jgi:hypothetical protein
VYGFWWVERNREKGKVCRADAGNEANEGHYGANEGQAGFCGLFYSYLLYLDYFTRTRVIIEDTYVSDQ